METIEINVYLFNELNEKAKQKVKNNWQYDDFWQSDRENSYKKAKELYNIFNDVQEPINGVRLYKFIQNRILPELRKKIKYVKSKDFNSKYASSNVYKDEKARFSKIQYCEDAINLTGYSDDYDFLQPIFDFLKIPCKYTTNEDLANTNIDEIYNDISQREYEYFYTDEVFSEHMEANGYEFTEDGERI